MTAATPASMALEAACARCMSLLGETVEGPLVDIVAEHLATGGKRFRAQLAIEATHAMGGKVLDAVPLATACELVHNASLIHDDIQDGDAVRRGRPAVWAKYGTNQAINAGDLLLMLPFVALSEAELPAEIVTLLTGAMARRSIVTACGQADELALRAGDSLGDWEHYMTVVRRKTGAFCGLPVEGAALIAGRSPAVATQLGDCAAELGTLFQMRDDVLDLYGDKGRQARGNDLREGKPSALVVTHASLYPEERPALRDLMQRPREQTTVELVTQWSARFRQGGALETVLERMRAIARTHIDHGPLAAEPGLQRLLQRVVNAITDSVRGYLHENVSVDGTPPQHAWPG